MDSLKESLLEPYTVLPVLPGDIIVAFMENPTNGHDIILFVSIMYNSTLCFHHHLGLIKRRRIRFQTRIYPLRINRTKTFEKKLHHCTSYRNNDPINFVLELMRYLGVYTIQNKRELFRFIS